MQPDETWISNNISENEQVESVYNTATILDPNTPSNIEEALRGNEKEAWN